MRKFLCLFLIVFTFNSLRSEIISNDKAYKKELYKYLLNKSFKNTNNDKRNSFDVSKHNRIRLNSVNSTVEKFALDSVIMDLSEVLGPEYKTKIVFEYDSKGNNILENNYQLFDVEKNNFVLTDVTTYKYDNQNRKVEETNSYYDQEYKLWYENYLHEFSYNNDGQLSEKIIQYINGDDWQLSERIVFLYNSNGDVFEEQTFNFASDWHLSGKKEYTYNSNNQIKLTKSYYLQDDEWVETEKTDYVYLNGNLIEKTTSYFYDDIYEENYSETYEYYEDGSVKMYKSYNIYDGEISIESQEEYVYDDKGNILESIEYDLNEETEEYEKTFKSVLNYDYSVGRDELLIPSTNENELLNREFFNKPLSMDYYIWFGMINDWLNLEAPSKMYYSTKQIQLGVDIKPISKSLINIYPNPVVDILKINLDKVYNSANIEILDITGKSILNQNLNIKKDVNVDKLINGSYIYMIELDGQKYSGKFIKN